MVSSLLLLDIETSRLIWLRDIHGVDCKSYTKHVNSSREQKQSFLNVAICTYNYHWYLCVWGLGWRSG